MADPFLERAMLFYQQSEVKVTKSMIHVNQFILKKWNSFRDSPPYDDVALKLRRKFWPRISRGCEALLSGREPEERKFARKTGTQPCFPISLTFMRRRSSRGQT